MSLWITTKMSLWITKNVFMDNRSRYDNNNYGCDYRYNKIGDDNLFLNQYILKFNLFLLLTESDRDITEIFIQMLPFPATPSST